MYLQTVVKKVTIVILFFPLCLFSLKAQAQEAPIAPDGTTPTDVNQLGNVSEIDGGDRVGDNLFHSFRDFSVLTGNEAFFNNGADINNIISRVTGGRVSDLDGLIRANGSANLFLINPAGIIFGANAKLDIGGSFLASTADSLIFSEGEFSATNLEKPPLLIINAPIGLQLRENAAAIEVRRANLDVTPTQQIALVGGDVGLDGAILSASDGRIELGGLAEEGIVGLNFDPSNFSLKLFAHIPSLYPISFLAFFKTSIFNFYLLIPYKAPKRQLQQVPFLNFLLRAFLRYTKQQFCQIKHVLLLST
jgi:filamentous hemagglutinin family protein